MSRTMAYFLNLSLSRKLMTGGGLGRPGETGGGLGKVGGGLGLVVEGMGKFIVDFKKRVTDRLRDMVRSRGATAPKKHDLHTL